ncbi:hypothetical protein [Phycicoccus duodecadis]|uniref:Small secreted domain DUF320 n=1 Tax=Phycicoccus duodecadis TaxID=173053 RepID=A0A2N3YG01_9MICO|nr:hypothetical protein [Phycicoccus duodecadis]PKW25773.1 hypothetical protein ATL31_0573 [Phycicoccus duodecadis]
MSLTSTVAAGTLIGGLLATGVYAANAPSDQLAATARVAPTFAPVPTPTVVEVEDCEAPAVLVRGACVTNVPGPTVTVPAPVAPAAPVRPARPTHVTAPAPAAQGDDHAAEATEPAESDGEDHADDHESEPAETPEPGDEHDD